MFTLVYIKNQFNRPSTLLSFLQSNAGKTTMLQIDCITPYQGSSKDLIREARDYLNSIDSAIEVSSCSIQNCSTDVEGEKAFVHFMVVKIAISHKK